MAKYVVDCVGEPAIVDDDSALKELPTFFKVYIIYVCIYIYVTIIFTK
jgi:hypothetical protein